MCGIIFIIIQKIMCLSITETSLPATSQFP